MKLKIIVVSFLLLFGLSSCFPLQGKNHLELVDNESGRRLLKITLKDREEVVLYWKNSLFNLDVIEKFIIYQGEIILTEVSFLNPTETPTPSLSAQDLEELYQTGGPFSVKGIQKRFTQIEYRIGEVGHPRIMIKGQLFDLKEAVGFGGKISLKIHKCP